MNNTFRDQIQPRYTEVLYNLLRNDMTKELIDQALSDYPLYQAVSPRKYGIPNIIPTREQLNKKILDYYKYREIAFETPFRFFDELRIAMNEIMPKYNQLMFSTDQDYDIKFNVDYKRTLERNRAADRSSSDSSSSTGHSAGTASDTQTTSASTENNVKNVHSETPQNDISVANTGIDNVSYADDITWNKATGSDSGSSTGNSSSSSDSTMSGTTNSQGQENEDETTEERTFGNYGATTTQSLIAAYRDLIVNIEQQIINDPRIAELFMQVYSPN